MARGIAVAATSLLAFWMGCNSSPAPIPARSASGSTDPALHSFLDYYDRRYDSDAQMLLVAFSSPGYHSRFESGSPVHPTRESLIYALALLQRGDVGDDDRAAGIVRVVLSLQDIDRDSPTCGVWPWLLEEPIAEMDAPDLNWADFCGALLGQMLVEHSAQLPDDLRTGMRESLTLAARAIQGRDVGPAYTNIAIIGGGVCAVCGELLNDDDLLAYGRERLQGIVAHTAEQGSFNEYNSPPYTCVALAECERTLQLVRDRETREAAESLRRTAWEIIAGSFHADTHQWAGPHSRTSRDRLRPRTVAFLERRTGAELTVHPSMLEEDMPNRYAVVRALDCPDDLAAHFQAAANTTHQLRRTFIRGTDATRTVVGTTWFTEDACLGSINQATFWTQRKPLLAYWKTEHDPAVVFRVRFLHDGRDFASMGVHTTQEGSRALSLIGPVRGQGDWHTRLDRPDDGLFEAVDLRLRCELRGSGVVGESLSDGRFSLSAGGRRIVIHSLPGRFAGQDVVWELSSDQGHVYVDAICHQGEPRHFDFNRLPAVELGMGIELLSPAESAAEQSPSAPRRSSDEVGTTWMLGDQEPLSLRVAEW